MVLVICFHFKFFSQTKRFICKFINIIFFYRIGEDAVIRREAEEERKLFEKDQETTWYHEGPESLRIARLWMAEYSLPRAKARLEEAKRMIDIPAATKTAKTQELQKRLQAMSIYSSQVGDTRPISFCQFSPNSKLLATASW